jgi:voltage-gated potassium channel
MKYKISKNSWKEKLWKIVFQSDTRAGKLFDIFLLLAIIGSVFCVVLESVAEIDRLYGYILHKLEWFFTFLFTIEFILRLIIVESKRKYIFSFFGFIDFLTIVPSYLTLFFGGNQFLLVIRIVRLVRIFRILKLVRYLSEANILYSAIWASRYKVTVFLTTILCLVLIMGTLMFLIEGPDHGYTSIPQSMYWAIVTLTTVGYGDMAPKTSLGQAIASFIMVMGYGVIAVPTGIVSVEISNATKISLQTRTCSGCSKKGHEEDASFCKYCGSEL